MRNISSFVGHLIIVALAVMFVSPCLLADVVEDWGTIVTPLEEDLTFNFEQNDIAGNFTDEYTFALEGEAGASYSVTFNFDFCERGCGNVEVAYAIYDLNGNMVTTVGADGTVVLEAGNYSFQVKGTGFGAGNSVDYSGSVTFSSLTLSSMVSPAPEPPAYLLMLSGILGLLLIRFRAQSQARRKANPAGHLSSSSDFGAIA